MAETIAIVLVFAMIFAYLITRMAMRYEERKLTMKAGNGDAGRLEQILTATQTEVARLRDRVQVLERLATDDDRKLATDIERLRTDEARR